MGIADKRGEIKLESILFVNACARDNSRTKTLAKYYLSKTRGKVEEVDLNTLNILPLDKARLNERDDLLSKQEFNSPCFILANQFALADEIVIAAPFWDLSFPSVLKIYLENICVSGITFKYDNDMPVGLCKAKRIVFISTSGGPFIKEFGANYIETLFYNLFGIEEFISFIAENLDIDGVDIEAILNKTKHQIDEYFK